MAKLGFTGFALAGCLALTSINASGGMLPSVFDYPEAKAYADCQVDHAKKRALAKGPQMKNADINGVIMDALDDCKPIETQLKAHMRANGLSEIRMNDLLVELGHTTWNSAWDEVARIRLAQFKVQGAIR